MIGRILLAEDDPQIRRLVTFKLSREGFQVYAVRDGKEALSALKDERFDLILLDVMMPVLDGFETLKRLSVETTQKTPIIMLSAKGQEQDVREALLAGASDYIIKPFDPHELVNRVRQALKTF